MSEKVREVNTYFRNASRKDVDNILSKIILSKRQSQVFDMYYIKRLDVCFIADTLCVCDRVVKKELSNIRKKIEVVMD